MGDLLRSDTAAASVSEDFSARFAQRFAAEPALLAPQRTLVSRFSAWPTALAALAATGFGFFVAPTLFNSNESSPPVAPSITASAPAAEKTLIADAKRGAVSIDAQADYIRMHHAAYSPIYGAMPGSRSPSTGKQAEH
jgi:anti-sigma-K factor RskA